MNLLLNKIKEHYTDEQQFNEIKKAIDYVSSLSENADKIYNNAYSLGVCDILLNVMVDYKTVVAGILYPYVKNGSIKIEQVKNIYDTDIYDILSTILKLEMLKINTKQSKTQNVKDMLIAMAKDIRVIILKLAIEVHKTIILDKYSKDEQKQIMQQINDIYSPLSAVIGIGYIKNRLENELFLFFKTFEYSELKNHLHKYVEARNKQIKVYI